MTCVVSPFIFFIFEANRSETIHRELAAVMRVIREFRLWTTSNVHKIPLRPIVLLSTTLFQLAREFGKPQFFVECTVFPLTLLPQNVRKYKRRHLESQSIDAEIGTGSNCISTHSVYSWRRILLVRLFSRFNLFSTSKPLSRLIISNPIS